MDVDNATSTSQAEESSNEIKKEQQPTINNVEMEVNYEVKSAPEEDDETELEEEPISVAVKQESVDQSTTKEDNISTKPDEVVCDISILSELFPFSLIVY